MEEPKHFLSLVVPWRGGPEDAPVLAELLEEEAALAVQPSVLKALVVVSPHFSEFHLIALHL